MAAAGLAAVAVALWPDNARFGYPPAIGLGLGLALLALACAMPEREPGRTLWGYPAVFLLLLPLTALTTPGSLPSVTAPLLLAAPIFFAGSLIPAARRFRLPLCAAALIGGHAALIHAVPSPDGQDVFVFLNHGVDALLRGHNPYAPDPAVDGAFVLTYPPAAVLLLAPFRVLLGDVRWGYLLAEAVSIALMSGLARKLGRRTDDPWLDALILLPAALPTVSLAFFILTNHDLVLVALGLAGLRLALAGRRALAGVLLGLGVAAKQYFIVFPVLFIAGFLEPGTILMALAAAAAVILPFLAWDPAAMLEGVFGQLAAAPDPDRLTLWAVLDHLGAGSRTLANVLALAGSAAVAALAWLFGRDLGASLRVCGLALALFAFCAPFAGYNYYAYAIWLLCCGLAVPDGALAKPAPAAIPG